MVCHWEDSDCVTQEVFYNVCICFHFCVWPINIFAVDDIPSFSCLPGCYHMYLRCFCCPDSMIIYTHPIPSTSPCAIIIPSFLDFMLWELVKYYSAWSRSEVPFVRTVYGINTTTAECRCLYLFCYSAEPLLFSSCGSILGHRVSAGVPTFTGLVESRVQHELPVQFLYSFVTGIVHMLKLRSSRKRWPFPCNGEWNTYVRWWHNGHSIFIKRSLT